jgi:hypothetical protein
MWKRSNKTSALLLPIVCAGFLCLCQVACEPNNDTDSSLQGPVITPDKFLLDVKDIENRENLVSIRITPGSPDMRLEEFFVTAFIVDDGGRGAVQGRPNKEGGREIGFTIDLNDCNVATLDYKIPETKHGQKAPITFEAQVNPGTTIKVGETYTLVVTVERKGNKPHTETKTTTRVAAQAGKDLQGQVEEGKIPGETVQTVPLDTRPEDTTRSSNHTTSSTDVPIATEKVNATDTSAQTLASDTGPRETLNSGITNTASEQHHSPPDVAVAPTGNANEIAAIPASDSFTVMLRDETRSGNVKNFVLVTIQPSGKGMALKDFIVTASLSDNNGTSDNIGTIEVSSDKHQSGFDYYSIQGGRSLENIFLTDANCCLGRNNKNFSDGAAVSFKMGVCPSSSITPSDSYTLTVRIAHMANKRHTKTESIELTASPQSPKKGRNQASPRNRGNIQGRGARK